MTDPLSLLRQYNINKKEIIERDGQIIFGEFSYPKSVKTNYIEWPSGENGIPKEYYTLECLLFMLKNESLVHPVYVRHASKENVPIVRRPDRKDLLAYLNGEMESCSGIDKNVPLEIPAYVKRLSDDASEHLFKKPRFENKHVQRVWEKLAKRLEASKQASVSSDNIKPLSEVISAEKVAAIKAKRLARKKSPIKSNDDIGDVLDLNVDVT